MEFSARQAREMSNRVYHGLVENEMDSLLFQVQESIKRAASGFQRSVVFKVKGSVSPAVLQMSEQKLTAAGYGVTVNRRVFGGCMLIIRW